MSVLGAYRGLLSNRALTRLLVGEFVSSIGDWLYLVALLVVVYRETADPVVLGIVGAARIIPYVLLSVPAGFVADRFDRRLVLLSTDLIRGAIMLVLAWLVAVEAPIVWVVVAAITATCFSTFFGPAIGSYIPALVRDERELGPANSAWSTLDSLAYVVGPAVAGLLIAFSDLAPAFVLNALSFAFVAAILWGLPSSRGGAAGHEVAEALPADSAAPDDGATPASRPQRSPGGQAPAVPTIRAVIRPLAGLTLLDVVSSFAYGGLGVLTVVIASDQLGTGEQATGYLNAAVGIGGMIGAVGASALVLRPNLSPILLLGAVGMALGMAALGWTSALAVALLAMTLTAAGSLIAEVVATTVFQRIVPDAIRGRALGSIATIIALAMAAGSLVVPILAASVGTFPVLAACAAAIVLAAVAAVALAGDGMVMKPDEAGSILLRVRSLPVFAGVPPMALEIAAARAHARDVEAGSVIIRQGEPADRFYMIERGRFAVDQLDPETGEERRLRTMGPDEVFGELGLLHRAPRSATITALDRGRLLWLDGPDFLELVSAGPGLAARLVDLRRATLVSGSVDEEEPLAVSAG